jgi:hypothetical protein
MPGRDSAKNEARGNNVSRAWSGVIDDTDHSDMIFTEMMQNRWLARAAHLVKECQAST